MKKINGQSLGRVYIYIYIDKFSEIKINKKEDSKTKPVIDTG